MTVTDTRTTERRRRARGEGRRGGIRLLLSVLPVLGAVFSGLAAAGVLPLAGSEAEEGQPGTRPAGEAPAGAPSDKVHLGEGTTLEGTVLDLTSSRVVLLTRAGSKRFLDRQGVSRVERGASPRTLRYVAGLLEKAATLAEWRKLGAFCKKHRLFPEYRHAMRKALALDPADEAAHLGLGEARLGEEWISEEEAEAKRAEGYVLKGGRLAKPPTRVADRVEIPAHVRILARQKLSAKEGEKLEKARAERDQNIEKFRQKLEEERRGIAWTRRHKIETRHFTIHCNSTLELAQRYAKLMEIIRAKLASMFGGRVRRQTRSDVFIYANQDEFLRTDLFGRFGGRGLGGYYIPEKGSITAFHGTFGFTGTTFGVLCHEGTHYYQGLLLKDFDNVPRWLIEGMAVYFGDGSSFDPVRERITVGGVPRDRLAHIQEKMLKGRSEPLSKLIRMTYRNFSGSHYADAWALIYFLVASKKGERLLQAYWQTGIERQLQPEDFELLARRFFGGMEALEMQYRDFVLKLEPPPAGQVQGDYFVSDLFQFEYKAPGPEWQFFEDREDRSLLVGLLLPGTSARIRLYYQNNFYRRQPDEFLQDFIKLGQAQDYESLEHEKITIGGRSGFRVRYLDPGRPKVEIEIGPDGKPRVSTEAKEKLKEPPVPRDVVSYLLVEEDGVATIECATAKGHLGPYRQVFDQAHDNFHLLLSRRW